MRGEQTTTIDGRFYRSRALPTMTALDIQRRLTQLLTEPIFLLFAAGDAKAKEGLKNPGVRAEIVYSINTRAKPGDLDVLREMLTLTWCSSIQLGDTTIEGNVAENFDEHFRGDLTHLMNVVEWVIGVNFAGPFGGSHLKSGTSTPTPEPAPSAA